MAFPWNYLHHNFVMFMDAYSDGRVKSLRVEDMALHPTDERVAARTWGIANDVDMMECDELLALWRAYRKENPPPVPENVTLGEL